MTSPVQGGAALPVVAVTDRPVLAGPALPVYGYTEATLDRPMLAGPTQPVYLVSAAEVAAGRVVAGGPPLPMVARTGGVSPTVAGPAIPVYLVGGSLNPTPTYTDKVKALNPIAYWPLADASGSVATDESGNGRNGTYSNVTLGVPGIGDGRTAATFNGTNAQMSADIAGLLAAWSISTYTIALWMRVSSLAVWTDGTDRYPIAVRRDGNNNAYFIKSATNNLLNITSIAGGSVARVDPPLQNTTSWLHLAQTFSKPGDIMRAFLNGAQVGTTSGLGTWAGQPTTIRVGSLAGANFWSGDIAHAAVFASALSAAQIASLAVVS